MDGVVKIIPPASWNPPFQFATDDVRFTSCVQRIDQLQNRRGPNAVFLARLLKFHQDRGRPLQKLPQVQQL